MILDTSVLIDILRGADAVADVVDDIDSAGTPFVSAVTVMELWEGVHRANVTETERQAVERLLTDIHELGSDETLSS